MILPGFLSTLLPGVGNTIARVARALAPVAIALGAVMLVWWAGYIHGLSVARAEAAQVKADALAAHLAAQRAVADQLATDRNRLAEITEKLDKRQNEIRRLIRERVQNENLDTWYRGDINSVERVALYGLPPATGAGNALPDPGPVADPADTAALP